MTGPRHVTTAHGQVRLVEAGAGPAVVVLAGLVRAASAVAADLHALLPGRRVVVVELPGVGGSAAAAGGTVDEAAATVVAALDHLAGHDVDLVALDLAAALALPVATGLGAARTVLVDLDSARGWADHDTQPPATDPADDGTHLVALWAFLRDRRLLRADQPHLPRTAGDPPPDVADLSAGFVAAATRPAAWAHAWRTLAAALPGETSAVVQVAGLADLPGALPDRSPSADDVRDAPPVPPTAPAPGTALWLDHVDTAVGRAHLRRAGSRGRPVLVLSTGGGSSAQFEPVVRGLAETRTAVALDYFGNGLSEPLDRTPTIGDLADEAFAVADALGWDDFDVWGSHTGACTALEMAVTRPERIGRAVLEAPVVISEEFRADLQAHYFPDLTPDAFGTHVLRAWHWRRDVFGWWPWYRVEHAAARAIGMPSAADLQLYAVGILESGATYDGAYRAAFDYDTRARLPHLTRPALLTAGPHDMLANALDDAGDLVPGGLLTTVATPETVWWPDPDPVAATETMRIYRDFLDG